VRRAVLWRRLDRAGAEYFALVQEGDGWRLEGTAVVEADGRPIQAGYRVRCHPSWATATVDVALKVGGASLRLRLRVDDGSRWTANGRPLSEVEGCPDVDLGVSPSTNTLPIRRLGLAVGQAQEITATWVRFPELTVTPLRQRYTRLAEQRYLYESVDSGFSARLEVDDLGLVIDYEGIWERAVVWDGGGR
jgi:hypothetical protein